MDLEKRTWHVPPLYIQPGVSFTSVKRLIISVCLISHVFACPGPTDLLLTIEPTGTWSFPSIGL